MGMWSIMGLRIFKKGWILDQDSTQIKVNNSSKSEVLNIFCAEFKKEKNLHMIRIRIDTFSFDKITKGVKANLMEKLSHFGGTAGLFNGFTIICIFELIVFGITLIRNYFKNMKKGSNVVVAPQIQENEKAKGEKRRIIFEVLKKFEHLKQEEI